MNETLDADDLDYVRERIRLHAEHGESIARISAHTLGLLLSEVESHRASRPLEQAAMACADIDARIVAYWPNGSNDIFPEWRPTVAAYSALRALDAAAKQAVPQCDIPGCHGGMDCEPAPSSPPREDAATAEEMLRVDAARRSDTKSGRTQYIRLDVAADTLRAAVAAEGARKDELLKESAQRESFWRSEFDSRKAELAKLNRKVSGLIGTLQQERVARSTAQPAAGGEAVLRQKLEGELLAFGESGGLATPKHVVDALVAYLDARSSARAGG